MKRSTIVLIALAFVLGGLVYYYEIKRGRPRDEPAESGSPAFAFKREDLASISITRGGQKLVLAQHDGRWFIEEPIKTPADQIVVDAIVSGITGARLERQIKATGEEVKTFGLIEPGFALELRLKDGQQHSVRFGSKDFSGLYVYAQIDGASDVGLLNESLLSSSDKTLNDLRDRSVMGISQYEITGLRLHNEHGTVTLAKQGTDWVIREPVQAAADEGEMEALLSEIASSKASAIVSEAPEDLSKYGLDGPGFSLIVEGPGGETRMLTVGSREADRYYAKNSVQPQVFTIEAALFDKLNAELFRLRDKRVISLKKDELTQIRFKNPSFVFVAEKDKDGKWIVREPTDQKDKEAQTWRIFDPLENNKATAVLDKPSSSVLAKFRRPLAEIQFRDKEGKVTTLQISPADGEYAYVRMEGKPVVYTVEKQLAEGLGFKLKEIIP